MIDSLARRNRPAPSTNWLLTIILFAVGAVFFSFDIGNTSLWDIDEPMYAQALKEMIARHDVVTPMLNGVVFPDKPILNYWLMWAGVHFFGMNSLGLRIGSALMGAALVAYLYLVVSRIRNGRVGLITALMTLTALHSTVIFRGTTPDPLLILWVSVALLEFYSAYIREKKRSFHLLIFYCAMAMATLDKGPIGFLLPGLIITVFLLIQQDLRFLLQQGRLAIGVPVFLLLVLPWYLAVGLTTHWVWDSEFFLQQNIGRFDASMQGHKGPFFYYLISICVGLLPWSVFLPQALRHLFQRIRKSQTDHSLGIFLVIWAVVWTAFFSLSATKLPSYVWEAYPPLLTILALYFDDLMTRDACLNRRTATISLIIVASIGIALGIFGQWIIPSQDSHIPSLGILGLPYLLAGIIALILVYRKMPLAATLLVLGTGCVALTVLLVAVVTPQFNVLKPSQAMGALIRHRQGSEPYRLVTWHWYQPDFLFYAGRGTMTVLHAKDLRQIVDLHATVPVYLVCPQKADSTIATQLSNAFTIQPLLTRYEIYSKTPITLFRLTPHPAEKGVSANVGE
nr:glycosyltransferase family 39 protein [Acidithiobacillus sp. S30A2]